MTVLRARRLLSLLMLFVLVAGGIGRASVTWVCEGRVCSSSLARCCCASPTEKRDGSCLSAVGASVGACAGECSCTAVVTEDRTSDSLHAARSIDLAAVEVPLLPASRPIVLAAYVLLETPQVRAIPPPSDRLPLSPPLARASLRAPPAVD